MIMQVSNMKAFFVGQIIPDEIYNQNFDACTRLTDGAANVFYNALLTGLANNAVEVSAQCTLPQEMIVHAGNVYSGVQYDYITYKKNMILRLLDNAFRSFCDVIKWSKSAPKGEAVVIFNILRIGKCLGALLACKIKGLKTVAIVTDVPGHRINKTKFSPTDYIGQKLLYKFDHYVLLSDAMREIVRVPEDNVAIIEGFFDPQTLDGIAPTVDKSAQQTFTVFYAGSLHYKYGIMELVKAVLSIESHEIQLKIYGKGEAVEEIRSIAQTDPRICFGGQVSHREILQEEANADLLVNPRPVDEEYVKYSFPSKNMEYMASGTPLLTTRLPGMPNEYLPYVYTIDEDTVEGVETALKKVFEKSEEERSAFGEKAREFVRKEKSNEVQAKKIIEFIKENFEGYVERKETV
jgi:glycosyltransferase involved in cell wall biosynthesis